MKLKNRDIGLSSGGPLIAVVNEEDARKLDLHALDRIKITSERGRAIAAIDISRSGIKAGEIGLFDEVIEKLGITDSEMVDVDIEEKPDSVYYIKKKLKGEKLTNGEIDEIIKLEVK